MLGTNGVFPICTSYSRLLKIYLYGILINDVEYK